MGKTCQNHLNGKRSSRRAAQSLQHFPRWRGRKSKAKEMTTSPWLSKAFCENCTSPRILGNMLPPRSANIEGLYGSIKPTGWNIIAISGWNFDIGMVWFHNACCKPAILVSGLWIRPHALFEALSQLWLRFMPEVKYNRVSGRKHVETCLSCSILPIPSPAYPRHRAHRGETPGGSSLSSPGRRNWGNESIWKKGEVQRFQQYHDVSGQLDIKPLYFFINGNLGHLWIESMKIGE